MLPFWNLFGTQNSIKIEDPEKGITVEAEEKNFSGTVNGMNIQASFKSFHIQGSQEMPANLLGFFNPFSLFTDKKPQQILENKMKKLK